MASGHKRWVSLSLYPPYGGTTYLLFIISAATITRAAKAWLADHLDREECRRVIFMDRDEFLNHAARIVAELPLPARPAIGEGVIPF